MWTLVLDVTEVSPAFHANNNTMMEPIGFNVIFKVILSSKRTITIMH